ncbi:MAG TPA: hypothetical protein VFW86_01705, partial [Candidatus Limnocylindrales bacterium]|nr:hypothetical protein [Candidatus Limnocylindrales bacterium]
MTEPQTDASGVRWKIDGYQEWLDRQSLPIASGLAVDLMAVETAWWPRLGANAAFVHMAARDDFSSLYLVELGPGASTAPQHHLYEAVTYVLDGRGTTTFELGTGERRSFEWARGSLFALPLNVRYTFHNAAGDRPARLAQVTNLPMLMKLFRNEDFVFGTEADFPERIGDEAFSRGEGVFIPVREHRHMWETNLVPDLLTFDQMRSSPGRGAGSSNIMFVLADGTMHGHMSEIPPAGYKKAHVHNGGLHIFQLSGEGYSLYWRPGEPRERVDWRYGILHSPATGQWHQHFNVSDEPARYIALGFGSLRYPFTQAGRAVLERDYRVKSDYQIDAEDQDPEIQREFEAER